MVYLRAGWSLGNVPDRYIFAGAGGDQLVGRFIAMLPQHEPRFASLPPHFTTEGIALLQRVGLGRLVPCYDLLPNSFKRVIPYFIATLLYHEQWLRATFRDMNHPLWKSALFTHNLQAISQLKRHVVAGIYHNEQTKMTATGIPGYISMAQQLKELQDKMERRDQELMALLREHHQLIIRLLEQQPEKLREHLLLHFDGLGPRAATTEELKRSIDELKGYIDRRFPDANATATNTSGSTNNHATTQQRTVVDEATANQIWAADGSVKQMQHFWGQQFRYCCDQTCTSSVHEIREVSAPHNFQFKNMPLKQAFSLWYLGNDQTCTGPYRLLSEKYCGPLQNQNKYRKDLSNCKRAMMKLYAIALEQHCVENPTVANPTTTFRINKDNWSTIFDSAFEVLQDQIYSNKGSKDNRLSQLTVNSLCNQLTKYEGAMRSQQN
jgi:hypothetical protein